VQYGVNKNGRYQSAQGDHGNDIVGVYILKPTGDHLVLLRIIHSMGKSAFEGKFMDVLMKGPNRPPSMHQAMSKLNDLVDGGLVSFKQARKVKHYRIEDKALPFLK
jgi:hypothetical protein